MIMAQHKKDTDRTAAEKSDDRAQSQKSGQDNNRTDSGSSSRQNASGKDAGPAKNADRRRNPDDSRGIL